MSIRKRLEQLKHYHDTNRLLIRDLELRHTQLLRRVWALEEVSKKDLE